MLVGAMGVEGEEVLSSDGGGILKKWEGAKVFEVGAAFDSNCNATGETFVWGRF